MGQPSFSLYPSQESAGKVLAKLVAQHLQAAFHSRSVRSSLGKRLGPTLQCLIFTFPPFIGVSHIFLHLSFNS